MSNIKPAMFRGNLPVSVIDHSGRYWLTSEDVGRCLGFADGLARISVNRIYARHTDEFSKTDSTEVNLTSVDKKQRDMRVFSMTGCIKLGFFAGTKQAKAFRTWAAKVLASPVSSSSEVVATLQAEYLRTNPEMRRVLDYYGKGLTQAEIGRLLGVSSTTAHHLQTVMTPAQEVIAVHLRQTLRLPLDDLLAVMKEFVCPEVSRSGLDRCLRRHGVGNLRDLLPTEPKRTSKKFQVYDPGFIHK